MAGKHAGKDPAGEQQQHDGNKLQGTDRVSVKTHLERLVLWTVIDAGHAPCAFGRGDLDQLDDILVIGRRF